jgi:hypothetical protein
MSCSPTNPCYGNTVNTGSCGISTDPCHEVKIGCANVIYNSTTLPNTGINTCDNLCVALQKIDNAIVNTPGYTVTASNGLRRVVNNIQLGGNLIEPTVVTATVFNTLAIEGLVNDPLPDFIMTETVIGVVRRISYNNLAALTTASALATLTADNGLTKTGTNIQLGGQLTIPTTITTSRINTLSIPGLPIVTSATHIVTIDPVTGLLNTSAINSIIPGNITADNGITKTLNNVQLGGALIKPTTIGTDAVNTLSITGLPVDTNPSFILVETVGEQVKKSTPASVAGSVLNSLTASNGLNKTVGNVIKLGGALTASTAIELTPSYNLTIQSSTDTNYYSTAEFEKGIIYLETGTKVTADPNASYTRIISYRSSAAMFLTNYNSDAYNAQSKWQIANPWVSLPIPAGNDFQITDNVHAVNVSTSRIGHFYDERVGNPNWNETWTGGHALVAGKNYYLRTKKVGDIFQAGIASSTISGTADTTGWRFVANGIQPTTWTNGSTVDGDFPVIELAQNAAEVICEESGGNGQVTINAINTVVTSSIDQRTATRGIMPAQWLDPDQPVSPNPGEMGYNLTDNKMEYWNGSIWVQF